MEINMLINMVTEEIYLINIFVGSSPTRADIYNSHKGR